MAMTIQLKLPQGQMQRQVPMIRKWILSKDLEGFMLESTRKDMTSRLWWKPQQPALRPNCQNDSNCFSKKFSLSI